MSRRRSPIVALLALLTLVDCAPAPGSSPSGAVPGGQPAPSRTMVVITRVEPRSILSKGILTGVFADGPSARRLFNAALAIEDEREVPQPYLAERLPELNTDSWRVFPDGRMETTWRLRPSLTWHDGTPLTAEDFVFSWRVFVDPEITGLFTPTPQNLMEEVLAPDPRTVIIRWRRPFPDAGSIAMNRYQPLPRHILDQPYQQGQPDAFAALPYWTREFVGLGPFRIEHWEPGAGIDGVAFDGHALGRPKIDRVRVLFISDANTVVANLLSEAAHVTMDDVIRFQQGSILKREWAPRNGGTVLFSPAQTRYIQVQFRPDVVSPRAILNPNVRKALVHSIDKKELADALLEGEGIVAHMMVSPLRENYADIDRAVTKYPYDPRRADALMVEAGFTRGANGTFASATGERFSPELRAIAGGHDEQELSALTDLLRRAGFDVKPFVVAAAQATDGQFVATFPALSTANTGTTGDTPLVKLWTGRIPRPENRWTGSALGGWSNPEYDRLYDAYNTTLDRSDRNDVVLRLMKLVSDEVPALPLYYNTRVDAHVAALHGPVSANEVWNVHQWELR